MLIKFYAISEHVTDRVIMDFDLNNAYSDTRDCEEGRMNPATLLSTRMDSSNCPSWLLQSSHQSSPPQTSGNSDTCNQSQTSSHGGAQVCHFSCASNQSQCNMHLFSKIMFT